MITTNKKHSFGDLNLGTFSLDKYYEKPFEFVRSEILDELLINNAEFVFQKKVSIILISDNFANNDAIKTLTGRTQYSQR